MVDTEVDISEDPNPSTHQVWPSTNSCYSLSAKHVSTKPPQSSPGPQPLTLPHPAPILHRSEAENSCMEIEAAQRKLQEIEDRYINYDFVCRSVCF